MARKLYEGSLMPYRILVYEDNVAHFKNLCEGLTQLIAPLGGPKFYLYHTKKSPNPLDPYYTTDKKTEKAKGAPQPPYPIGDLDAELVSIGNDLPSGPGLAKELWPAFFHAAVLDIYQDNTENTPGLQYLEWLARSEFCGPVVLASFVNMPTGLQHALPELFCVPKGGTSSWAGQVADRILAGLVARNESFPYCGSAARRTRESLELFYKWCEYHRNPPKWEAAWIGKDKDVREGVLHFFCQKWIFDMNVFPDAFDGVGARSVHTAWIDAPKGFTADLQSNLGSWMDKTFGAGAPSECWIVVLADYVDTGNNVVATELQKRGVIILPRKAILEEPHIWAEKAVKELIQAITVWKEQKKIEKWASNFDRKKEHAKGVATRWRKALESKLMNAYLPVHLMARAKERIAPNENAQQPNILAWFDSSPSTRRIINGGLNRALTEFMDGAVDIPIANSRLLRSKGKKSNAHENILNDKDGVEPDSAETSGNHVGGGLGIARRVVFAGRRATRKQR